MTDWTSENDMASRKKRGPLGMFRTTKSYGHERGFSTAFRQYKAQSHCKFIHGYALAFDFTFACEKMTPEGWVVDFGDFKCLEEKLHEYFDHTCWVSKKDPHYEAFKKLHEMGIIDMRETEDNPCCEVFAHYAWMLAEYACLGVRQERRLRCESATVREHGSNSATYYPAPFKSFERAEETVQTYYPRPPECPRPSKEAIESGANIPPEDCA